MDDLRRLLVKLFATSQLLMFIRDGPEGSSVANSIGQRVSAEETADAIVLELQRRGLINHAFFERLTNERPEQRDKISEVRDRLQQSGDLREPNRGRDNQEIRKLALVLGAVGTPHEALVEDLAVALVLEGRYQVVLAGSTGQGRTSVVDLFARKLNSQQRRSCKRIGNADARFGGTTTWRQVAEVAQFVILVGDFSQPIDLDEGSELEDLHRKMRRVPHRTPWLPLRTDPKDASTRLVERFRTTIYGPTPTALSADIMTKLLDQNRIEADTLRRAIRAMQAFRDNFYGEILPDDIEDIVADLDGRPVLLDLHRQCDAAISAPSSPFGDADTMARLRQGHLDTMARVEREHNDVTTRLRQRHRRLVTVILVVSLLLIGWALWANWRAEEMLRASQQQQSEWWADRIGYFFEECDMRLRNTLIAGLTVRGRSRPLPLVLRSELATVDVDTMREVGRPYLYASRTNNNWTGYADFSRVLYETPPRDDQPMDVPSSLQLSMKGTLEANTAAFRSAIADQDHTWLRTQEFVYLWQRHGRTKPTAQLQKAFNLFLGAGFRGPLIWSYVGFDGGLMAVYPASPTHADDYDATKRGWHMVARNRPGQVTWFGPYGDAFGDAGNPVLTLAMPVKINVRGKGRSGVAGIDIDARAISLILHQAREEIPGAELVGLRDPERCLRLYVTSRGRW